MDSTDNTTSMTSVVIRLIRISSTCRIVVFKNSSRPNS